MSSDDDGSCSDSGAEGSDDYQEQPLSNEEDHSQSLCKKMLRDQDSQREAEDRELCESGFSREAIYYCPSESGLDPDLIDIDHETLKNDVKKYNHKFPNAMPRNLQAIMHIQKQHKRKRQSGKPEPARKRPAPFTPPRKGRIPVQSTQKSVESEGFQALYF
jgi:hypothetical protein